MPATLPLFLTLLVPIGGGLALALYGDRDRGPEINVAFSAATLAAAVWLTADVVHGTPMLGFGERFFVDPLNVFLVPSPPWSASRLRSFRAPTCASSATRAA